MMNEFEIKRFNNRVSLGEVRISAEVMVSALMTESVAEVDITVSDPDNVGDLYNRVCQYAIKHGEDYQSLFQTERYQYMSCLISDTKSFISHFANDEILKPLFNHGKGDATEFIVSFPDSYNYGGKDMIKKSFLDIIQEHVETIPTNVWGSFIERAMSGVRFGDEIDRNNIQKLSRKEFVASNLMDSFETKLYTDPLKIDSTKIGQINTHPVFFNSRGFYFYLNSDTKYLLESWLTYPAYPYGW